MQSILRAARGLGEEIDVHPEARTRLMHECERAKIDLSSRTNATIFVPAFFVGISDESLELPLSRFDLEEIIHHLLMKGIARIERLLHGQNLSTASVALCLATGGMVNMPAVKARLHELFGPQRVHVSDRSASLISEGAAWVAHDGARLHLAKNVELSLARNSYVTLLRAGLEMPTEGEVRKDSFKLYCVDPSDGHGKFELVSPYRPGPSVLPNDKRRPLCHLLLEVDSLAAPFRERLELDVEIDEDLILRGTARSLNKRGLAELEIHDLEFALATPSGHRGGEGSELQGGGGSLVPYATGDLLLRSNLAAREDKVLVPGEILYPLEYSPSNLSGRSMSDLQWEEHLYYQPCSLCNRASNDPLCRCASELPGASPEVLEPRTT